MRKYTIGTDYSIPASDITRMALLVPTYGSINSFIYNTQIFNVDKYTTTVNIGAMFKNDGTSVLSGQIDAELILFPLE